MFSSCHLAQSGKILWNVWHDLQESIYDIHSSGAVPKEFDGIVTAQKAEQDACGGDKSNVDYPIDAPINLAASFAGYCYDQWRYNWGEPKFTVIGQAK